MLMMFHGAFILLIIGHFELIKEFPLLQIIPQRDNLYRQASLQSGNANPDNLRLSKVFYRKSSFTTIP